MDAACCQPGQVLYIGDDLRNDVHAATAAGLHAILFDPSANDTGPSCIRRLRDLIAR
jgi:putative hydrolase of the HAD superfamily